MRSVLAALLVVVVGSAGAALATDTDTATIGDPSGNTFTLKCRPGTALEGFAYGGSNGWAYLSVFCQPVVEGTLAGFPSEGQSIGSKGSGKAPDSSCNLYDPTMVIISISVYLDDRTRVHQVRATCHVIAGNKIGVLLTATVAADAGKPTGPHQQAYCGPGSYAVGLVGTYSGIVHSLGLICHEVGDEPTTPQNTTGDTTTEATPRGTPEPDGSAVAVVDTTIYSKPDGTEVAYINAGDPVTIIKCKAQGKGWCQIGRPKKGYVWGPDLQW